MKIWTLLVALWLIPFTACEAAALRFIIPSGATTESSRLYWDLINEFHRAEPGIKIVFEPMRDWDAVVARVQQLHKEHSSAGLFVAEVSETLELESKGLIQAFDTLLEEQGGNPKSLVASISPPFLGSSYCASKKLCGIPFFRSMPVALYNLDQIKAAGLSDKVLPQNWAELETLLEGLKQHTHRAPFFLGGEWYDWLFEATVIQAGGELMQTKGYKVVLNTPMAERALTFWKRLKDKGLLERSTVWKDTLTGFTSGRYPVTYYSSGGMEAARSNNRFAWMADMMPKDKENGASFGGGNLYAAATLGADEKAAAVKFTQFLYQASVQARISAGTGYFPVMEVAYANPLLRDRYTQESAFVRARAQLKYAQPKLMAIDNLRVREILKKAIDRCLDGGADPHTALQAAQQEIEALPRN